MGTAPLRGSQAEWDALSRARSTQCALGQEKYETKGIIKQGRTLRAQQWDASGDARAASMHATRELGPGPKTANESDQKQFHRRKESVEVQGGAQSQSDGECTVTRHTK